MPATGLYASKKMLASISGDGISDAVWGIVYYCMSAEQRSNVWCGIASVNGTQVRCSGTQLATNRRRSGCPRHCRHHRCPMRIPSQPRSVPIELVQLFAQRKTAWERATCEAMAAQTSPVQSIRRRVIRFVLALHCTASWQRTQTQRLQNTS